MGNIIEYAEHPIERLMNGSMNGIRALCGADTIIGTPVNLPDGKSIIPISRVAMGFLTGGGEYSDVSTNKKNKEGFPFAGGSGGGVTVSPIGFLVCEGNNIRVVSVDGEDGYDKLMGLVPDTIEALVKGLKS